MAQTVTFMGILALATAEDFDIITPMVYQSFLEGILKEASDIAREKFGKVSGTTKPEDNNQVLTDADLAIGRHIISRIDSVYPQHNIIDEEAGVIDRQSELTWVIDPIDGTSNFAQGIPLYGIMIGLLDKDVPIAGGIALPFSQGIYTAEKGQGAYCNGERIHATEETNLLSVLVAYCFDGHQENPEYTRKEAILLGELALHIRNLRITGSTFDYAMVAQGKFGGYLNRTSKIWDNVAPQILLEEAGCLYTDYYGNPMDYANPLTKAKDNYTFCTAPRVLHEQLQKIVHQASL